MAQKIKFSFITICVFILFNTQFVYAAEDTDEYKVSFKYYPQYNVKGSTNFVGLGYHTVNDLSYIDNWEDKTTYTITTSPVAIYSVIDRYNDFTFSIEGIVESDNVGQVNTFKLINMNVYYEYYPTHILTEAKLEGTLCSFIPDAAFQKDCTMAYLQGKNRTTGEWTVLKTFELHSNEFYNWSWEGTDNLPSWNFSAYRINFSLWNWNYDGLTLIANGKSSGINRLVCCDYSGVETNDWEKRIDELVDKQDSIITKLGDITKNISSIGDLIESIPDIILDGIYNLIVPSDMSSKFHDYIDELLDSMGILGFPFEFAKMELEEIANYNAISTINVPDIEFMGETWLENYQFDFATIGNIKLLGFNNFTLIYVVRMITSYLLAMALIYRVKVLLYDFGILKNPNDDIGGDI